MKSGYSSNNIAARSFCLLVHLSADLQTTDTETTRVERDTEKSGGAKQDIVNLPAGCSITVGGGAALGLILLISCAAVLVQKKRTRVD